jgi:hypothetical protein
VFGIIRHAVKVSGDDTSFRIGVVWLRCSLLRPLFAKRIGIKGGASGSRSIAGLAPRPVVQFDALLR